MITHDLKPSPRREFLRDACDIALTAEIKREQAKRARLSAFEQDIEQFNEYAAAGGSEYKTLEEWQDAV